MLNGQSVSLEEAIEVFGLSRSSVLRRLKSGALSGRKVRGKWLIDIPIDRPVGANDSTIGITDTVDTLSAQLTQSKRQLDEVTRERDTLTAQLNDTQHIIVKLEGEIEYFKTALAMALSNQQKLLTNHSVTVSYKRPWWKFWERESAPTENP